MRPRPGPVTAEPVAARFARAIRGTRRVVDQGRTHGRDRRRPRAGPAARAGVEQVFGYPGDGINGLIVAFGNADDQPRFIQARHEEMSAMAAVGYAKFRTPRRLHGHLGTGCDPPAQRPLRRQADDVPVVAIVRLAAWRTTPRSPSRSASGSRTARKPSPILHVRLATQGDCSTRSISSARKRTARCVTSPCSRRTPTMPTKSFEPVARSTGSRSNTSPTGRSCSTSAARSIWNRMRR